MEEIKFRGKRKDTLEWVEGDYFRENHLGEIRHCIIRYERLKGCDVIYEVIPETVGRFTGLTDKNGKEIYEGDIMGRLFDDYDENTIILYHKGILCARPISKDVLRPLNSFKGCGWVPVNTGGNYRFEIIGNIHDNPELLTSK